MEQVDVNRVTEAFMLVNWIFKSDNYEYTIAQKFKAIVYYLEDKDGKR